MVLGEFTGNRRSLIRLNSLNIRNKIWKRIFHKIFHKHETKNNVFWREKPFRKFQGNICSEVVFGKVLILQVCLK